MTQQMYAIIGYALLSIPFLVLAGYIMKESGWKAFVFVFGITALIVGLVYAGTYFLQLAGIVK